jgi:hypothetical protein
LISLIIISGTFGCAASKINEGNKREDDSPGALEGAMIAEDLIARKVQPFFTDLDDSPARGKMKITYLGPQTKSVETVVLAIRDTVIPNQQFFQFQKRKYGNDEEELNYWTAEISEDEFYNILRGLKQLVANQQIPKQRELLSFCVMRQPETRLEGFELTLSDDTAKGFYSSLLSHLKSENRSAQTIIKRQAGSW